MPRKRFAHRGLRERTESPFHSSEEAWFWYTRCQRARLDGARFDGSSGVDRPCDPDDVYRVMKTLIRADRLNVKHLRVLLDYGFMNRPPDPRVQVEEPAARMWEYAMDQLKVPLCEKGIIEWRME